jgi:hypothetical protein
LTNILVEPYLCCQIDPAQPTQRSNLSAAPSNLTPTPGARQ